MPGLLGDHDRQRVGVLGDADRRAVAAAEGSADSSGFTVSGRKQAAAATRLPWITTAPSWSGVPGLKMLISRS